MLSAVRWIGIAIVLTLIIPVVVVSWYGMDQLDFSDVVYAAMITAAWLGVYFRIARRSRKMGYGDYQAPKRDLETEDRTKTRQF